MCAAVAKPASTVVVVRPSQARPCEVLLVRRNDTVDFMAGAFVFPGGRVDEADRIANASALCDGLDSLPRFPDLTADQELEYRVAAIRELVEEASILFARRHGRLVERDLAAHVSEAMNHSAQLPDALANASLRLAVDAVLPIAHWVTPEPEPRRYDTRFFLAVMPEGQEARHDASETTELMWVTPADAMARCRAGEIMLPPPTWTTLARLARMADLDEVLAWARSTRIVRVEPTLIREGSTTMLTLPGDPRHPPLPGWEVPDHTRFVLEEGRGWLAMPGIREE
jgi:8-oxo-dGTP pyrophosphatase MutT (NUDIX family)